MFVESPVAGTNKHMAAVRSHGPSTHLNSSSGMCDYKSAYDLSSLGNWGDEAAISQTREHRPSLSHTQIAQSSRRSNCSKDKTKGGGEVDNENRQPSPAGADRFYSDEASQATYQTSLHIAAEHGQESVVGIILASGVMVDEPDSEGNTALHLATQTQQLDVVLRLLEHGANPNATNMRGWTPVHLGISTGSLDIVQALVNHGGDLSRRAKCKK
ncbi:ankyrin repeat-containing domain protein [Poronia punctata]|nr:ankyrin repeat-containing domain protein [Poronia punctata]